MAAGQFHVNGEASITYGGSFLGVSEDGVDVSVNQHVAPCYLDTYGGPEGPPFDEQYFLEDGDITIVLPYYVEAVLAQVRAQAGAATDGTMPEAGTLFGQQKKYKVLKIASPIEGLPYIFPSARLTNSFRVKLGTRRSAWNLTFHAIPYSGVSGTSVGAVLYTRK